MIALFTSRGQVGTWNFGLAGHWKTKRLMRKMNCMTCVCMKFMLFLNSMFCRGCLEVVVGFFFYCTLPTNCASQCMVIFCPAMIDHENPCWTKQYTNRRKIKPFLSKSMSTVSPLSLQDTCERLFLPVPILHLFITGIGIYRNVSYFFSVPVWLCVPSSLLLHLHSVSNPVCKIHKL